MLGVWLWWQPILASPHARWRAWKDAAVLQMRVYATVAALLALGAICEAL